MINDQVCINCNKEFEEHIPSMFEHPLLSEVCSQECFEVIKNNKCSYCDQEPLSTTVIEKGKLIIYTCREHKNYIRRKYNDIGTFSYLYKDPSTLDEVSYYNCCSDQGGHAKDETCDMWRAYNEM